LTLGFGGKWKLFFQGLECHDGLNPDLDAHIWLLHFLFLDTINQDAVEWAETWNNHIIAQRGSRHASPHDMFFFGMLEQGVQGFDLGDEIEDVESYGIDWTDFEDSQIQSHHVRENPDSAHADNNPFLSQLPTHLNHVEVPVPDAPLSTEHIALLRIHLQSFPFFGSRNMDDYHLLWITALNFVSTRF
jgi:hypothetical protein